MNYGRIVERCRMCGSPELYCFLDLGFAPPSDAILSADELREPELLFPLKVMQCEECGLAQLSYSVNRLLLYGKKYKYEASITATGKRHFYHMADSICQRFDLTRGSLIVDVGSNVGVLLEGFQRNGMSVLGLEPAPEICRIANDRKIRTIQEFMGFEVAKRIVKDFGKAKVVTGTNVFAHVDDKEEFMNALDALLDEDGIFVIEAPYFLELLENLEYDTIYVEHLEYLSVKPLLRYFNEHAMEIFDVELHEIHGKSIRVFVCRKGKFPVTANVQMFLDRENQKGIYSREVLDDFARKVKLHRETLLQLLWDLKRSGSRIVGISAPAKGNTMLNYCRIGPELIDYLAEKSVIKRGHFSPGMHIPIVEEERIYRDGPAFGVIFAWNFADEIMRNNDAFARNGGKFIIPIPEPVVVANLSVQDVKVREVNPVHFDHRGNITDILNETIEHAGLIETKKEGVRGNHYHKRSVQHSYLISGLMEVVISAGTCPDIRKILLKPGQLITIPPGIRHSFKAIEDSVLIDLISESRAGDGYERDVVRVPFNEVK
jgi:quercetin dioxygenase-like cupin family protein/SAM-dependent methyltransferase